MSSAGIKRILWWVCLVAAPAVLIGLELFHPAHFTAHPGMFEFLSKPQAYDPHFVALGYPGPQWWFTLHFIQTPVVGLVAVGLWLLAGKVDDTDGATALTLAWLSRAATLTFLLYHTALDSIGGTGLARLLLNTHALAEAGRLTPSQVEGVALVLNATWVDPWVGGIGSFISEAGSWAVLAAVIFAVAALFVTRKAPWPPLVVLLAFGWQLETAHASPHGPIAFALLIVAAIWLWWLERATPSQYFDKA
jgi:hypothetical protein